MNETSKAHKLRALSNDYTNYLHGEGIDIGAGPDPLHLPEGMGSVVAYDKADGDAQLMAGIPSDRYDFVYSSHCLEHMRDVPEAMTNWARILKPDRFLYVVVPDYTLYEQHCWPSRFNGDHKHSFSIHLDRYKVDRINHWSRMDLATLAKRIGLVMVEVELQDQGFNYNAGPGDQTLGYALAQIMFVFRKFTPHA